ncbi:hypothetical protein M4I21_00620 [Cellulophaga sp. 20_2_10]|uniref:hypothetical protein n=1 Tax=Cellulophaga sp. 20_2_10 TaxID=2942476 RepID=UPI00201B1530|nr:hypothetical protein [Cellulophaga sp. 20_2_10]MCL5244292.1 hypothetical protein [Cellulophaga sp. 20_2_10]
MRIYKITTYIFVFLAMCSCATLKKAPEVKNRIELTENNLHLINGTYQNNNKNPANASEFFWGSFFRRKESDAIYHKDSKDDPIFLITLEAVHKKRINATVTVNDSVLKTIKIRGRIKNGYFEQNRKMYVIPMAVLNVAYTSKFRIGLQSNNNVITDFRKVEAGTVYFFHPFNNSGNLYNLEHKKVTN